MDAHEALLRKIVKEMSDAFQDCTYDFSSHSFDKDEKLVYEETRKAVLNLIPDIEGKILVSDKKIITTSDFFNRRGSIIKYIPYVFEIKCEYDYEFYIDENFVGTIRYTKITEPGKCGYTVSLTSAEPITRTVIEINVDRTNKLPEEVIVS